MKIVKFFIFLFFTTLIFVHFCNYVVNSSAKNRVFNDISKIEKRKVGLVLGTSRYLRDGNANPFFHNRIKATIKLYKENKIEFIIASGDNSLSYYNEPKEMKKELIKNKIPANRIFLDYAGFRTLDSIVRCNRIFNQKRFTVISQKFQNQRAIYISKKYSLDVIGFNAKNVSSYAGLKTKIREYFARIKAFIDINIIDKQPKFLGKMIEIK